MNPMRWLCVLILVSPVSANAETLSGFRKFVAETWNPTPSTAFVVKEFLRDQVASLKSLSQQLERWLSFKEELEKKGEFSLARCVERQRTALTLATKRALSLIPKLQDAKDQDRITVRTFDLLTDVGQLRKTYEGIQESLSECELQVRVSRGKLEDHVEIVSFRVSRSPDHAPFDSLFPFEPAQMPYR